MFNEKNERLFRTAVSEILSNNARLKYMYLCITVIPLLSGYFFVLKICLFLQDYLTDDIRNIMKQRPGTRTEEQIIEVGGLPHFLYYLYIHRIPSAFIHIESYI